MRKAIKYGVQLQAHTFLIEKSNALSLLGYRSWIGQQQIQEVTLLHPFYEHEKPPCRKWVASV